METIILRPFSTPIDGHLRDVFVRVTWDGKRLSICGVEGPRSNGDCHGSAGQLERPDPNRIHLSEGWTIEMVGGLWDLWARWHLNDMRPGCEHQRSDSWRVCPGHYVPDNPCPGGSLDPSRTKGSGYGPFRCSADSLGQPCPTCGYRYGTAWLVEEVPAVVLDRLRAFPRADREPAWA